jgi:WD40 repeat protein
VVSGFMPALAASGRMPRFWVGEPFTGHTGTVLSVAVGELDGRPVVVSGATDTTVQVWDLSRIISDRSREDAQAPKIITVSTEVYSLALRQSSLTIAGQSGIIEIEFGS